VLGCSDQTRPRGARPRRTGDPYRDHQRRRGTVELLEALDQRVRAFHAAAVQLLQEVRQVIERVGPLNEIVMRLAWIESAIARSPR
jgi:hypothetical protein